MVDTDKDWETFAQQDAYYSVLTRPEYADAASDPEAKERFFESGRSHVEQVLVRLEVYQAPPGGDLQVLDFGCGVGRLLIPFAEKCEFVVGVDVSQSMLEEARRNIEKSGRTNAVACRLEEISHDQRFDLIHSTIVFQHIPKKRGLELTAQLLDLLKPHGMIALHYTFARGYPHSELGWKIASRMPSLVPWLRLLKLQNPFKSRMLMVRYDLNALFHLLHRKRVGSLSVDIVDDQGELGVMIYGQR